MIVADVKRHKAVPHEDGGASEAWPLTRLLTRAASARKLDIVESEATADYGAVSPAQGSIPSKDPSYSGPTHLHPLPLVLLASSAVTRALASAEAYRREWSWTQFPRTSSELSRQ